jgi:hypothetical protein
MTNIMLLPQMDGTQSSFAVTNNGDWVDTICFTSPGSTSTPLPVLGVTTAASNTFTVSPTINAAISTVGLVPGMPFAAYPGFPLGGFVGAVLSSTQVTLVDGNGNPLNSTIGDAEINVTFEPLVLDITGIRFRAHLRPSIGSPTLWLGLDTTTGSLINGGTSGLLSFNVPQSTMALVPPQTHVLDILAIADNRVFNVFPNAPCNVVVTQGITSWPF